MRHVADISIDKHVLHHVFTVTVVSASSQQDARCRCETVPWLWIGRIQGHSNCNKTACLTGQGRRNPKQSVSETEGNIFSVHKHPSMKAKKGGM